MLDTGSGMKASDRTRAKNAAKTVLGALGSDDSFTVLKFDSEPQIMSSTSKYDKCVAEQLVSATPDNKKLLQAWFDG